MQKLETKEEIIYTCDSCKKEYVKKFISFDLIDDIQMRILEYKPQIMNNHYTYGRKKLDFCGTDCALNYLNDSMKMFIKEITIGLSNRK